jgi:hypothetical protein
MTAASPSPWASSAQNTSGLVRSRRKHTKHTLFASKACQDPRFSQKLHKPFETLSLSEQGRVPINSIQHATIELELEAGKVRKTSGPFALPLTRLFSIFLPLNPFNGIFWPVQKAYRPEDK